MLKFHMIIFNKIFTYFHASENQYEKDLENLANLAIRLNFEILQKNIVELALNKIYYYILFYQLENKKNDSNKLKLYKLLGDDFNNYEYDKIKNTIEYDKLNDEEYPNLKEEIASLGAKEKELEKSNHYAQVYKIYSDFKNIKLGKTIVFQNGVLISDNDSKTYQEMIMKIEQEMRNKNLLNNSNSLLDINASELFKFRDKILKLPFVPSIQMLLDYTYNKNHIIIQSNNTILPLNKSDYISLFILSFIKENENIDIQNKTIKDLLEERTLIPDLNNLIKRMDDCDLFGYEMKDFLNWYKFTDLNKNICIDNIQKYIDFYHLNFENKDTFFKSACLSVCAKTQGEIQINPDGLIQASKILNNNNLAFEAYKNTKSDFYKYYNNDISEELPIKALENNNVVKAQKSNTFFQLCKDHWIITFIFVLCSTCGSVYVYDTIYIKK